ncbi:MAG TPA: transcription antitermination factor NusB [Candidatus Acidoferrales bacterium]|nr:transcription antitermination factor NusB [Candidatus Acidoferrales bacterium]
MTLRRKSRECALQMLFEWGMNHQSPDRIEMSYWMSARGAESTRRFANQLFEGAVAQAKTSDSLIEKLSKNWRVERIAEVDRGILRLAIYELRAGTAPIKVVINEAIELAKKFSSSESAPFLNGILDAAAKSLEGQ